MEDKSMEYNTGREFLVIPEYGRNIQTMIEHLLTIEDREKRTQSAHFVISVMAQMNPQVKESIDYMHKLWDHMHIISGYRLDVESPYPAPSPEVRQRRPKHIGYSSHKIKYGHYGQYNIDMIEKVKSYDDGEEKDALVLAIANNMKMSYLSWNRETVADTVILDDLRDISGGIFTLSADTKLISPTEVFGKNPANKASGKKKKPNKKRDNYQRNTQFKQR